ncbi:MAG: hypothetical protein KDB96_18485, partial [Flavobacteriales bacterium]|nr:hypothetical protein [Flavobacteriales bacterium]
DSHVGVGTTNPVAKLTVYEDTPRPNLQDYGLMVHQFGHDGKSFGGFIKSAGVASVGSWLPVNINAGDRIGLRAESFNATSTEQVCMA